MPSLLPIYLFISVLPITKKDKTFLAVLGLCCCPGFSLLVASGGHSPVAVCGPLLAVVSSVAEHRLQDTPAQ